MKKHGTFGNANLANKITSQFGSSKESVKAEMRYTKVVQTFVRKVDEAHKKAAESKLKFG